jgi:hypothetical protein
MKAQELRCKNYVTIYGNLAQIVPNDFVKWSDEKWEMKDIQPILLTEEWLLKFGFEWNIAYQAIHKEGFDFDLNSLYYGGYSLTTFKKGTTIVCFIEYVQQLQNLYFALTGEELTINQ